MGEGEGKIAGVLLLPDGRKFAFVSGRHGGPQGGTQAGFIPRGYRSGVNRFTVTHIEGHAAATLHRVAFETMGREGVGEAALLLPKPPCGACDPNIPQMLPKGTRLFVVDPDSTAVYQSSRGLKVEGPKFPRASNNFFGEFPKPTRFNFSKPGSPGPRPGAGAFLLFVVGIFIQGIQTQNEIRDREEKEERLEAEIRHAIPNLLLEAAEIQFDGHQPRVKISVVIEKITVMEPVHPLAPPIDHVSYQFRLNSVSIGKENADYKTKSQLSCPNPFKCVETWTQISSFEVTLPELVIQGYREFRTKMQWFDDAIGNSNVPEDEKLTLNRERNKLSEEFNKALDTWGQEFAKKPPPAYHPAPAPPVTPPLPPPPPPLPPPPPRSR
jgi:SCP1.201-like deaminase